MRPRRRSCTSRVAVVHPTRAPAADLAPSATNTRFASAPRVCLGRRTTAQSKGIHCHRCRLRSVRCHANPNSDPLCVRSSSGDPRPAERGPIARRDRDAVSCCSTGSRLRRRLPPLSASTVANSKKTALPRPLHIVCGNRRRINTLSLPLSRSLSLSPPPAAAGTLPHFPPPHRVSLSPTPHPLSVLYVLPLPNNTRTRAFFPYCTQCAAAHCLIISPWTVEQHRRRRL